MVKLGSCGRAEHSLKYNSLYKTQTEAWEVASPQVSFLQLQINDRSCIFFQLEFHIFTHSARCVPLQSLPSSQAQLLRNQLR